MTQTNDGYLVQPIYVVSCLKQQAINDLEEANSFMCFIFPTNCKIFSRSGKWL